MLISERVPVGTQSLHLHLHLHPDQAVILQQVIDKRLQKLREQNRKDQEHPLRKAISALSIRVIGKTLPPTKAQQNRSQEIDRLAVITDNLTDGGETIGRHRFAASRNDASRVLTFAVHNLLYDPAAKAITPEDSMQRLVQAHLVDGVLSVFSPGQADGYRGNIRERAICLGMNLGVDALPPVLKAYIPIDRRPEHSQW